MSRRAAAPTMPHMALALLLRGLPGRNRDLPGARHGELSGRRVLADRRARADIGAARNAQRRDQRRVRADEAVVLDHGTVLRRAIAVACDRTGANVDAGAGLESGDGCEVVRLRARAEAARLDLDEIAHVDVVGEARAGPQPRERADAATRADFGLLEVRNRAHLAARGYRDIAQHAVGAHAHV